MAQAGYTPISLYFSTTAAAVPTSGNLANGELAINIQDEKLYFKNAAGTVKLLASNATSAPVLSFSAGTTGLTPNTATTGAVTLAGTLAVANGGTGVTTSTGTTNVVLSNSPTLVTPDLGTPSSGVVTNLTGTASININGTVGATTAAAGAFTTLSASSTLGVTGAGSIQGLTVGLGGGAVATNTAVGVSALAANTTAHQNTAFGHRALTASTGSNNSAFGTDTLFSNTTGTFNAGFGLNALAFNTTGSYNTAVGAQSLFSNTTASNNTAVGYQAGYSNTTGTQNLFLGYAAGYSNTTGTYNTAAGHQAGLNITTGINNALFGRGAGYTVGGSSSNNTAIGDAAMYYSTGASDNTAIGQFALAYSTGASNTAVGSNAGNAITTGSNNTILGRYNGNQDSLDIRTASNYVVLSDGDGNRQITMKEGQTLALDSAVPNSGTGITFPATQSASSNANTLDDYEEGTYVVTLTPDTSGSITLNSSYNELSYIKVGSQVTIFGRVLISSVSSPVGSIRISMPFTPETSLADQSDFYAMPMFTHDVDLSAGALSVFGESSGTNYWVIYQTFDNAGWTALPSANLKGNGNEYVYVTGSYRASA